MSNYPASRVNWDSHAFLHDDKFDTWLDLTGLFAFREICKKATGWRTQYYSEINGFVSGDTISELCRLKLDPSYLGNCRITSHLPALINQYTLNTVISKNHMKDRVSREHIDMIKRSSLMSLNIQVGHILSNCSPAIKKKLDPQITPWSNKTVAWPVEVMSSYHVSEDMMKILSVHKNLCAYVQEKTASARAKRRVRDNNLVLNLPSIKGTIIITHDIMVLTWKGISYLLDRNLLLEMINKSCELFCTLLYSHLQSGSSMPENHYQFVIQIIEHYCGKVKEFIKFSNNKEQIHDENKGYIYLKMIEGLGVACLIRRGDRPIWDNALLTNTLWKSVVDEGLDHCENFESSKLGQLFSSASSSQICEVLGLIKLAGHPSIEVEAGLKKLYDRTHENIVVNEDAVQNSIHILTRDLFKNFYLVHKRYPNINLESINLDPAIKRIVQKNINVGHPTGVDTFNNIPLEAWGTVQFGKNNEFDYIDKQLTLLKDKSIGMERTKAWKLLLHSDSTGELRKMGNPDERKALLHFLMQDEFGDDFRRYINQYEHDDPWRESVLNYLVIKLTPKELEEKPEGRMFGASPNFERNRRIVQEYNTMKLMSKYIPDQLLTPDELTMIKKLYSFRHLKTLYPNHTIFQVSFDFSKWNNSMRRESIDVPGSRILDRWFGVGIYGRTMEAYNESLIYYVDNHVKNHWEGQLGGIEGLNQATWSLIFIAGIKQALERIGVTYQLTVKGDDVRAALAIENVRLENHGIKPTIDAILETLSQLCRDMGWSLNPQESFVSFSVICTSKQYQVNDTWMPASCKKMMKAESLSNLVFPTTEDIVASVFSTAHSACAQTTVVLPCFATANILAARTLARDMHGFKITHYQLTGLLCWPQVLGGPGSLPLQTFFVRGENDMLAVSLSLLRHALTLDTFPDIQDVVRNILGQELEKSPNKKLLLSDPYAIPLDIPERPSAVMKRLIEDSMKLWVKNPDLLYLLSDDGKQHEDEFVDILTSFQPLCPKLMTALYENSPFYLKQEVISKFMMSSTIFNFFQRGKYQKRSARRAHAKLRIILKAAKSRMIYWSTIIKKIPHVKAQYLGVEYDAWVNTNRVCTTEITTRVREHCWGGRLSALTYPSLVDQNMLYEPEDLLSLHPTWDISASSSQVTVHSNNIDFQSDDQNHHYAAVKGIHPWLGAKTALKLVLPDMDCDIKSPTLTKILNLVMIRRTGYYIGPQFTRLVDKIIEGFTSIRLDWLQTLMPEGAGGHIAHRTPINSFSMTTMPNVRPNIAQLVTINDESLHIIKGDTRNRTLNFAARHYFLIALSTFELQVGLYLNHQINHTYLAIFHNDKIHGNDYQLCNFCLAIVEDEPITISGTESLDLSKYNQMPMVGASLYDEEILRRNILKAGQKQRRLLEYQYLDPENLENIRIASIKLLSAEYDYSIKLFNAARSAGTQIVLQGELLNIVGVNWMGIQTSHHPFSVVLMRAIPNRILYDCVVQFCFQLFIMMLGINPPDVVIERFTLMQEHLNPLSGMFTRLNTGGVLRKLSAGCGEAGLIDDALIWPPGAFSNGHVACKYFYEKHKHLFVRMIKGNADYLPKMTFYTNMESDDTIQQSLHHHYIAFICAIINRVNIRFANTQWLVYLNNYLIQRFEEQHINVDDVDDAELYDIISQLMNQHLREIIDNWEDIFHISDRDKVKYLTKLFHLAIVVFNLIPGSWVDFEIGNLLQESILFTLVDFSDDYKRDILIPEPWNPVWIENIEGARIITDTIGSACVMALHAIGRAIYNDDNIFNLLLPTLMLSMEQLDGWLLKLNNRVICCMSSEDAERILKRQVIDLGFQAHLPMHMRHNDPDPGDFILDLPRRYCAFRNDADHYQIDYFANPYVIDTFEANQRLTLDFQQININFPIQTKNLINALDWSYYWSPCITRNWTTGRLWDVMRKTNADQYIRDIRYANLAVCIGDGCGGCSKLILAMNPNIYLLYVSKYFGDDGARVAADGILNVPPYEFQHDNPQSTFLTRLIWSGLYPGDITDDAVRITAIQMIKQKELPCHIFLSDAEFNYNGYIDHFLHYYQSFFDIFDQTAHDNHLVIIKFQYVANAKLYKFLLYLRSKFQHFHIIRSNFSRNRVGEFYIIMSDMNGQRSCREDIINCCINETHSPPYHIRHVDNIVTQMRNASQIFAKAIFYGINKGNTSLIPLMPNWFDLNLIRPLQLSLEDVGITLNTPIVDCCRWWIDISRACTITLRDCIQCWIDHVNPRRGGGANPWRQKFYGSRGQPLATGYGGTRTLFKKLVKTLMNESIILEFNMDLQHNADLYDRNRERCIIRFVNQILNNEEQYKIDFKSTPLSASVEFNEFSYDINMLFEKQYHKMLRLFSQMIHVMTIYYQHDNALGEFQHRFYPHAEFNVCCREYIRDYIERSREITPWVIPRPRLVYHPDNPSVFGTRQHPVINPPEELALRIEMLGQHYNGLALGADIPLEILEMI